MEQAMFILLQLLLFCLLFTLMVRIAAIGGGINALYFYPKAVQEKAFSLGLTDEKTVKRKRLFFMIPFMLIMLSALLLIVGLWNGVKDFWTAYLQALLFLEVMNWYDGIAIDKLWVGHSKLWLIEECADIPYVQTWKQVLIKRGILTAIWILLAFVVAGLIILIF